MARLGRQEEKIATQSLGQFRRFCHGINADRVFGTHSGQAAIGVIARGGRVSVAVGGSRDLRGPAEGIIGKRALIDSKSHLINCNKRES